MTRERIRVFVTDGGQRKAVPIVRALGRAGYEVTVGDSRRMSWAGFSRYCRRRVRYPDPVARPEDFVGWLKTHLSQGRYDVFLPIDEKTLDPVVACLDGLKSLAAIPVPGREIYARARDKLETIRIAETVGVPVPRTWAPKDLDEVRGLSGTLTYPLVIKPRVSSGSRGVVYVRSPDELLSAFPAVQQRFPNLLLQEYIPPGGEAIGVGVLVNAGGEIRASFAYKRLREYPITGGPSTLRQSVRNDAVVKYAHALIDAMHWYGVAMVEFRVDPRSGVPVLMEVNPKFWGSIQLAIVSGVDFPTLAAEMALAGDARATTDYKVGVQCRWLLPGDILHFVSNPRRFHLRPSFFRFWGRDLHDDIVEFRDPGPVAGFFILAVSRVVDGSLWKMLRR